MRLQPILLADGDMTATGWLLFADGAVRAILTPADGNGGVLVYGCDARLRGPAGYLRFRGLVEAELAIRRRLSAPPKRRH